VSRAAAVLGLVLLTALPAPAGHELTFYPSFYPQEISVRVATPEAAAGLLRTSAIHAYAGADAFPAGGAPAHVSPAESLRGWLVLTFPRGGGEAAARCAAAARVGRVLAEAGAPFVAHRSPVTPRHADWLYHAEPAPAAPAPAAVAPAVRAAGAWAEWAKRARLAAGADATLEEIALDDLLAPHRTVFLGWPAVPWLKEGWFHAWLLHAAPGRPPVPREAEALHRQRVEGAYADAAARVTLERRLVGALGAGCDRVVLGYTLRREALSEEYSEGVENVAFDAQAGIAGPLFVRTVKLKDFPWNGWLRLATASPPAAAWNPVAGFGDPAGRLVWAAVGDTAFLHDPDSARWIPNRARPVSVETGKEVAVPADALRPGPGGLTAAGPGVTARARVVYRVLLSKTHDGEPMTAADLLYPYAVAARWGAGGGPRADRDPEIAHATARARRALVAVRVARVDKEVKQLGEIQVMYDVPHVEVYLAGADPRDAPAVAPPWSAVPWPVLALAEEAVARGRAAFSAGEARRRRVPWLDLARDAKQRAMLAALAEELERRAWVPPALRGLVTAEDARRRWRALRAFAAAHGHYLVTAGPYQLGPITAEAITLPVFRDFSYPLGVGSFDQYPIRLRAWVRQVEQRGSRLEIAADVERVEKAGRSYKIVREPFRAGPLGERTREPLTAHWVVLAPGDEVVAAGASQALDGDRLVVDPGRLTPGAYRVVLALANNGNLVTPEVQVIPYRVGS
jgi:hypothetical protein